MSGGRVTSVDVARASGVSQSTVSLVFSGKAAGRVSAGTEAAVRAAATELGYRPNAAARALKAGVARTVALVVPDVTNPFFGPLLRGAQSAARSAGYAVALIDTANDRAWGAASAAALQAGPADGLMLMEVEPPPGTGEPIVTIESRARGHPSVQLDVEGGFEAVLDHLEGLGHTRFAHLASAVLAPTFRRRERVLDRRLGEGLVRVRADIALEAGRAATLDLLHSHPDRTALVCDDDVLAAGACLAARELGLAIPGGISVTGFDDLDLARVLDPPLTTVAADAEALGAAAFALLAARMVGRRPRSRTLPVELVVRGSTGPPRRGT